MSGTRTRQEIDAEYAQCCVLFGDLTFKLEAMQKTLAEIKGKMTELSLEIPAAQVTQDADKEKEPEPLPPSPEPEPQAA